MGPCEYQKLLNIAWIIYDISFEIEFNGSSQIISKLLRGLKMLLDSRWHSLKPGFNEPRCRDLPLLLITRKASLKTHAVCSLYNGLWAGAIALWALMISTASQDMPSAFRGGERLSLVHLRWLVRLLLRTSISPSDFFSFWYREAGMGAKVAGVYYVAVSTCFQN